MGKRDIVIRVGFIGAVSKEWMGGVNYYKNLLFAVSNVKKNEIKPIVFIGKNTNVEIKNVFKEYAQIVEHSMFDRKSFEWFRWKLTYKILGSMYFLDKLLKTYDIQVLSHSGIFDLTSCKTINWIPDFQHLHLPDMFLEEEIVGRNKNFLKLIKRSDKIVLSSFDALSDFNVFAPDYAEKVDVLQFVSQPDNKYFRLDEDDKKVLIEKYNLSKNFFYIPNQFWKHKNHIVVFEAIKILKEKKIEINVVCTGYMKDYRNIEYISRIKEFIQVNKLQENIKLLGLVDYEDVFALIKFSIAVINPSLFEGWSSTVEECKSVGKNMILSDLNVHKEQYPTATFFDRNDIDNLVKILEQYSVNYELIDLDLKFRTESFASQYANIVRKALDD